MKPAGRIGIRNIAGLGLEKDAAERISSSEENTSRARKSPARGMRGAPASKGARGSSRAILRRLIQHFDEPATLSQTVRGVWIFRRSGVNICFYTPLREKFFGRYEKIFFGRHKPKGTRAMRRDTSKEDAEEKYGLNRSTYAADEARIDA